jgi:hypothetical protein
MVRKLSMLFLYPNGTTPLDPDEAAGLLPSHISLQADLNGWEKTNISQRHSKPLALRGRGI